ncbi:MAG TPA: hypothetical protein VNN22_18810, partial [Verrucomicrobiae bacterium]|nr:hypothetical protein [Verrucomicrobiae bacterium]
PGATSYQVNVLRPLGMAPANTTATRHTLTGLMSGAPYVISIQALGTANGNPILTPARPITASTTGDYTTNNGDFIQMQATLDGVVDAFSQLHTAYVNGTELTLHTNGQWQTAGNQNAAWMAWQGTNQVVVKIIDQNSNVVFNDWATFVLSPTFTSNTTNYTAITDIHFFGQLTGTTPTLAGDPEVIGNNIPTNDTSVVIGLVYTPTEIRKYNPLVSVAPASSPVIIQNVVSLPGGGIQFTFDVPAGTNYVIESSANLTSWQTNATGLGQTGGESYTNAAGGNTVQFYRIKL